MSIPRQEGFGIPPTFVGDRRGSAFLTAHWQGCTWFLSGLFAGQAISRWLDPIRVASDICNPLDPTRPDPTRPDPTRPDPTRPDPTREVFGPDPTRPARFSDFG